MFQLSALALLACLSLGACAQTTPPRDAKTFRAMTYNIEWLSEDAHPKRVEALQTIVGKIQPDIVAVQEVQSLAAVRQIFPESEYQVVMLDDPREPQETAVLVRKPLKITNWKMLFSGEEFEVFFPGRRDGLRAEVQFPDGQKVYVYSLHWKSRGGGGRLATDPQRQGAAKLLANDIKSLGSARILAMGDFNDTPDDVSVNILESGDARATGGRFASDKPLMVNLCEPLYRENYVTIEMSRRFIGDPVQPVVPGAFRENERTRGINYRFPEDVQVTQTLFDQILVSPTLHSSYAGITTIFCEPVALRGNGQRVQMDDQRNVRYLEKGSRASDHLPVYADFKR